MAQFRCSTAVAVSFLSLAMLCAPTAEARRNNPPPQRTGSVDSGGATCQSCHDFNVGSGSVQILGAPTLYYPSQVYDLTVRVQDPIQAGAGFEMSAEDALGNHVGTWTITDATNTKINVNDADYVNHTSTGVGNSVTNWVANGQSADYTVRWTAPASDAGDVTFWAAGNAINDDLSPIDDFIYLTQETAQYGPSVPAVSTWGLAVLTLFLATCGTLVLRRSGVSAAA